MKPVHILTGPVHSGKTTVLQGWIERQRRIGKTVEGILAPIQDGRRILRNIGTGEQRILDLEPDAPEEASIRVGPYRFDTTVFEWAQQALMAAALRETDWLVIDEIGRLELVGQGLEPTITDIVSRCFHTPKPDLLLVVRDFLLQPVMTRFVLSPEEIVIHTIHDFHVAS